MLILFNTSSVRLSANMMMAMMKLNKGHVLFFDAANIRYFFKNSKLYFKKNKLS
jgi:predicted RNA-binding protein (virulence factor B family)